MSQILSAKISQNRMRCPSHDCSCDGREKTSHNSHTIWSEVVRNFWLLPTTKLRRGIVNFGLHWYSTRRCYNTTGVIFPSHWRLSDKENSICTHRHRNSHREITELKVVEIVTLRHIGLLSHSEHDGEIPSGPRQCAARDSIGVNAFPLVPHVKRKKFQPKYSMRWTRKRKKLIQATFLFCACIFADEKFPQMSYCFVRDYLFSEKLDKCTCNLLPKDLVMTRSF